MSRVVCLALALLGACTPARPPPGTRHDGTPPPVPIDAAKPDVDVVAANPDAAATASPETPMPPPASASVTVDFSVTPQVGELPPTLHVTVRNPGPAPAPLTRFDQPGCFVQHYLAIRLTPPGGKPTVVGLPCAITDWPGIEESLAAGASATIEVPLARVLGTWRPGAYQIEIDWDPSELERMRPGTSVRALSTSLDISRFVIARRLAKLKVMRDKPVTLPGGHVLTFRRHGHKSVMAGGPRSPLIIHGTLALAGKRPTEFSVNVFTDERRIFQLEDLVFELIDHAYDDSMELAYFGRFTLD